MPGVRLNELLASTAIALSLSAGFALAQATPPSGGDSTVTAPDSGKTPHAADGPAAATPSKHAGSDAAGKDATPKDDTSAPAASAAPKTEGSAPAAAATPPASAEAPGPASAPPNERSAQDADHPEAPTSPTPAAPTATDHAAAPAPGPAADHAGNEKPDDKTAAPKTESPAADSAPAAPQSTQAAPEAPASAATGNAATPEKKPAPAAANADHSGGSEKAGDKTPNTGSPAAASAPKAPEPANAPEHAQSKESNPDASAESHAPAAPAATGNGATPGKPPAPAATAAPADHPGGDKKAGAAAPSNAPTATAAPTAPTLSPLDQQIAGELRQLSSGKFDRIVGGKSQRAAIDGYYSGRSYAPVWITDGHANARAKAAMNYLAHVGADGLDPADYRVPDVGSLTDPQKLAEAELKFSLTVVTYARHASIGRVAWSRVDSNIEYDTKAPDFASVLAKLADAKDVAGALDGYEPHTPGYEALKAKLAEIRGGGEAEGLKGAIAHGRVLKVGEQDSRVEQLRAKLGVTGDEPKTYDKALAEAVKKFQKEHGLRPTGTLTAATVDAINGPRPTHVVDTILANMERWRWMPHDLGKSYVMINLPDFTASVFNDGKRIWKTKIVIGKSDMPTPIISASMKFITVNPTWHVPPSIINREYLPALAADPTVLQRMGLVVERSYSGQVIGIYQPPGDRNAEGRLRFNFPNKFLVYQHDTPDKYMFGYARRAFSHGCMRTQDPAKYAEVLLSLVRPKDGYTKRRIEQMYGPREVNIEFPTTIPVHVTYQTAFVDDSGKLEFRDDVYGRDRELLSIMHNPAEARVADIPVERRVAAAHREILQAADNLPGFGGRFDGQGGAGPGGFFARLFGGGYGPPQPPARVGGYGPPPQPPARVGGYGPPPQPPARVLRRRRISGANRNANAYYDH